MDGAFILSAVSAALVAARGEPVYPERVQQNIQRPCFLVASLITNQTLVGKNLYRFFERISITWVPPENISDPNLRCLSVGRQLAEVLHMLPTKPQPIRIANPDYEVVEGELVFSCDVVYRASLEVVPETDSERN